MSNFGNLLTTASSTVWSPFQRNVNVFFDSHITSSAPPLSATYAWAKTTGSNVAETNEYGMALGLPNPTVMVDGSNAWLMYWNQNTDPDGSGSITFDLDQGIGRTEALDSFIISSANQSAYSVGGYAISASNNGSSWTALTSSIYYPISSGTPFNAGYDATMTITNNTAYRYYKIMLLDGNGTYVGFAGITGWDSSLFKDQINLLNPNETNVTASFVGHNASLSSLEKLTSFPRDNYGIYYTDDIGTMNINWGDEKKLFRGINFLSYSSTIYMPGIVQFYKSDTGELDSWELVSTVNLEETQGPMSPLQYYFLDVGTPIKTQYLRIGLFGEGSSTETSNLLAYAGWMYGMISASAPPTPSSLTTVVANNDIALNWTQNSGSDNRLVDLIYNVERSSDGGSNYTKIKTLSGSVIQNSFTSSMGTPVTTNFVDTDVSDGSYLYRVQAENRHHLTTGSFLTSDSLTVPATSGGSSKKIYTTNKGNVLINPNDTILIELD